MGPEIEIIWKLLSSVGVGALIGTERGWHGRKEDEGDRVAGIRTFSLVGLLGGIWAAVTPYTGEWILGLVFLGLSALIVVSYIYEIRVHESDDIGITTEVALLLTFALGAWASFGHQLEAIGCAVAVTAILSLKPLLHTWLRKVETEVIYAGIKLLVISAIILPVLPNKGFGPWGTLNPYWIWLMVVLISALSFLGYLLVRYFGENQGTTLTAIIGGLASSTAVTISLAEFARQKQHNAVRYLIAGVLVASSVMFVRVFTEVAIINPQLLYPVWIPLAVMLVLTSGCVLWLWIASNKEPEPNSPELELGNPLKLPTALKFGALLAVILVMATALQNWFGDQGIYLLALLSGLMDVDAITLSLSKMAYNEISSFVATMGIVIAVISNTLFKGGLFLFLAGFKKAKQLIWMMLLIAVGGILSSLFFIG
ncbi:MgtC/SapB family protein [Balneola sp. MJW-20]|uniref:MgtC/SapB family protein n=1 Tax=Gracilimonas aurantiaca TaxID=3234185 RepID=UPI003466D3DC